MAKFAVDEAESGALFERALNHPTGEWVLVAPGVVDGGHARPSLHSDGKGLERIAALEERYFDDAFAHVAVGRGRVESVVAKHVGIELGDGNHGAEIVLERRGEIARTASDAMLEILFAYDRIFKAHGQFKPKVVDRARDVAEDAKLAPLARLVGPRRCDVGERPRRKVVKALGRVVEHLAGVGLAPGAAHEVGEAPGLLLFGQFGVAEEPGVAGLLCEGGVLARRGAAHLHRALHHEAGIRLHDVDVELGVALRVELLPVGIGEVFGAARAAEHIGVVRAVGHAALGHVAVEGVEVFGLEKRDGDGGHEPDGSQLRKLAHEAAGAPAGAERRKDLLELGDAEIDPHSSREPAPRA